ncbi:MAG: c-type cytochrome [Phycisphaeraceae bacterium]|nr:c-type cytochrome [Phycisphaeraceae bacterium]
MSVLPPNPESARAPMNGDPPLTDHEYDGIQEFDNPTPGWWSLIFVLTVVWSVGYWIVWELDPDAPAPGKLWEREAAVFNEAQFAKLGKLEPDEKTILSMMGNADWMPVAESIFRANCIACHGRNGEGNVGPNMTDDAYKNIKVLTDIPQVIRLGAAGGAMPAQRNLSQNEVVLVSAYVASLRGRNLPGRPAEGAVIAPWPKSAPAGGK